MHANQRHLFEVPREVCYLNAAYMAPRLRQVSLAAERALAGSARPWTLTPRDFFATADRLRQLVASLIGAEAQDIALVPSVSYGAGVAAVNLPLSAGQEIVLLDEQFPSNVYPWRDLARRRGARIVTVARPADGDWARAVLARLGARTAIVALPAVHWTDGSRIDLEQVSAGLAGRDVALVLDLTQSLGAVPFSLRRVRADFLVAAAYKWLLGPYGVAYLYAAPWRQAGRPLEQAWITRQGSEDFAGLVRYRDAFRSGACRYDAGEHCSFVLLPMALAALEQITSWGVETVADQLATVTGLIGQRAADLGYRVPAATHRSPHMLGLGFPGAVPDRLVGRLAEAGVYVSLRGSSMRVAPHLHVDSHDLGRFCEVLEQYAP